MLIVALARFGIESWRIPGRPGVWTRAGKIGAIGVRIERGVSLHGFALNVDIDLSWFDAIVPCGIAGAGRYLHGVVAGPSPGIKAVGDVVVQEFGTAFGATHVVPTTS